MTDGWGISCKIAPDGCHWTLLMMSTLVQVMAWSRQATSHYLTQCWPRFMLPYGVTRPQWVNSLAPGRCDGNFNSVISEQMLWIKFMSTSCETALRWMPQNIFDEKFRLIQVMAWCHKATDHYQSQCWPSFMSPCGVTGQRWTNSLALWDLAVLLIVYL